jgi:hypothetical protein
MLHTFAFLACIGGNLRYVLTASWTYRSYQTIIRVRSKGWLLLPLLTVSPVACQCVMTGSTACSNWVLACQNCFQLMVISVRVSVVVVSSLMHMWYVPTSPWFFLLLLPAAHVRMVIFTWSSIICMVFVLSCPTFSFEWYHHESTCPT